jgi:hypothetical protein
MRMLIAGGVLRKSEVLLTQSRAAWFGRVTTLFILYTLTTLVVQAACLKRRLQGV